LLCNLINNRFSNLSTVLYSVPLAVSFGSLITTTPTLTGETLHNIKSGTYSSLELQLYDQNLNPLELQDSQVLIVLAIQS